VPRTALVSLGVRAAGLIPLTVLLLTIPLGDLHAASPGDGEGARRRLRLALEAAVAGAGSAGARAGLCVVALPKGQALFSQNSHQQYIVASNTKLVTTAAALALLGPGYKFRTTVRAHGPIRRGVLQGGLVIRGSGDPSLSGRFFDGRPLTIPRQWAYAVRAAGISEVQGDIVADDRAFDREHTHPDWPAGQLAYWYCAETGALSFNDNCVDIAIRPAPRAGEPVALSLSPPTSYVRLVNRCITKPGKPDVSLYRQAGSNVITVRGSYPVRAKPVAKSATIHQPALFLATVFKEQLAATGIRVTGRARLADDDERLSPRGKLVATTTSGLGAAIRITNRRSQNFYAEQILKTLGRENQSSGSFAGGVSAVEEFLASLGIPRGSYQMADGSGLSRNDRFTPAQMITVLQHMYRHRHGELFVVSLPAYGEDAAAGRRGPRPRVTVRAKTGTLRGVRCLSGYVLGAGGRSVAFAILSNGGGGGRLRRLRTEAVQALVEYADAG